MLHNKLYLTPAHLLLLLLSCPLWQLGHSLPTVGKGPVTDVCVSQARKLLETITATLDQNNITGIDCSKQSVELNMATETPTVCAPKGSTCTGIKTEFNQESCLENIGEDLRHYYKFLSAQSEQPTVLSSLRELMEKCFPWSLSSDLTSNLAAPERPSTFDERLSLCKVLRGFHVRTVTINRAMGYMSSGDHTA